MITDIPSLFSNKPSYSLVVSIARLTIPFIICCWFGLNNFILKIRNNYKENESDSYIYGVLEANKDALFNEEYSYTLATLGKVFFEFCQEAYQNEPNIQDPFIIEEEESNSPLKVEL